MSEEMLYIALATWVSCGIIGMFITGAGGKGIITGFMLGLLLGPIGVVASFFVASATEKKTCPHCMSKIHAQASVCPKCQRDQPTAPVGGRVEKGRPDWQVSRDPPKKTGNAKKKSSILPTVVVLVVFIAPPVIGTILNQMKTNKTGADDPTDDPIALMDMQNQLMEQILAGADNVPPDVSVDILGRMASCHSPGSIDVQIGCLERVLEDLDATLDEQYAEETAATQAEKQQAAARVTAREAERQAGLQMVAEADAAYEAEMAKCIGAVARLTEQAAALPMQDSIAVLDALSRHETCSHTSQMDDLRKIATKHGLTLGE